MIDNKIKKGSTREMIHSVLLQNPTGLTGEELIEKTVDHPKRKTDIAVTHSLLTMVRSSTLVYRRQGTNPDTNRPCFYYHARTVEAAEAEKQRLIEAGEPGPAVDNVDVVLTVESKPEQELFKLIRARAPITVVMESYHKVLEQA